MFRRKQKRRLIQIHNGNIPIAPSSVCSDYELQTMNYELNYD